MKKETKKDVTVTKVVRVDYFCDKCGAEIDRSAYSCDTRKAIFQAGDVFPEGGSIERREAYFCESCGKEIFQLLETSGVRFTKEEIEL